MADTAHQVPLINTSNIKEIAPGVFVIMDRRVPLVPNIGIVLGSHSALVVDTGMGVSNGKAVLNAARKLAGDRKLLLTITHFHPEHGYGAAAFKGVATILYNQAQGADLKTKGHAYLEMFKGMGSEIASLLSDTQLVPADQLYEGPGHTIDLGGRRVELVNWGKAHTGGDQIIWLPDEAILFTGDLAEEKTFPIFPWFPPQDMDIDGRNWLRALDECLALKPNIVVPGHGDIGGAAIISDVRNYIADVEVRVNSAKSRGLDEATMLAELAPSIRSAHPDWHFPEWIDFAIRYYAAQNN